MSGVEATAEQVAQHTTADLRAFANCHDLTEHNRSLVIAELERRYRALRDRLAHALFVTELGRSIYAGQSQAQVAEHWHELGPEHGWLDRADRLLDVLVGPDLIAERAS